MRIAQDGKRLRVSLPVRFEMDSVSSRRNDRTDLRGPRAPVGDGARVGVTEARLVPDVRIFRSCGAQSDQTRRLIMQIPGHAVQSGFGVSLDLADGLSVGARNLNLHLFLRRGFQREIQECLASVRETVSGARRKQSVVSVVLGLLFQW